MTWFGCSSFNPSNTLIHVQRLSTITRHLNRPLAFRASRTFHQHYRRMSPASFAQGKGTLYTLQTSEVERISDLLDFHHLKKWGFVVYRCTYGDDAAWARFMQRLNERNEVIVRRDHENHNGLADRLDWRVQEDSTGLQGASKDEVRRRFRRLVATELAVEEGRGGEAVLDENPRFNYCVHVDAESMRSVLEPGDGDPDEEELGGYVNLVRADEGWSAPDFDKFDWSTHVPGPEDDPYDEGEEEIEGSRLADVGWMKVSVDELIPELYTTLTQNHLWDNYYLRPPEIMRI